MRKLFLVTNNDKFFLSHRKPIALAAKNAGYDVTVIAKNTGLETQITALGLKYVPMPVNTTGMKLSEEWETFSFLKKLYKNEKPDIIHHVGLKSILWGTLAANLCNIKNVINAVSGTGFLFSPDQRNSLESICVRVLLRHCSKKHYKYIFQNLDDEKEFCKAKIINCDQAVFIKGSGVNLSEYAYVSDNKKDNSVIRIVFTGRMIVSKGVVILINAARILKEKYSGKIQFLLCGSIDGNPTAISEEQMNALCDGEYVRWLGFQKNIYSILKKCHIMVFPSFYMEGLPKSIIDAEATGLPVITTDWVGCRDTVIDGYNGFIVPVKNSTELAKKIQFLIENPEKRILMGKNAREYAEKEFDIKNVIEKHLEVYRFFVNT